MSRGLHALAIAVIAALLAWWLPRQYREGQVARDYPAKPIQVVVPYAAGGGSDTFVRIIQRGMEDEKLLAEPLVIINQPGGIGTIGSREVKHAAPDGYKILCHHNAIITAKLAGTVSYGPEAFEPIALTGEMSMVVLVRSDAPFQDIRDLLQRAKESPRSIRFGANKGAPAYFTALQLEKSLPGAELSIVSSGGGADRYSKIIGGHLEAGVFSLSEYLDFRGVEGTPPQQDVRAIAVLSPKRHESIPEVPTATEVGFPVTLSNANYWWAPKGTPPDVLQTLADALRSVMQSQRVREELGHLRMEPTFDSGVALEQKLQQTIQGFEAVAERKSGSLPDFTRYVGLLLVVLMTWVGVDSARQRRDSPLDAGSEAPLAWRRRPGLAIACFLVLVGYVMVIGMGWLPLAVAVSVLILAMGGMMLRHSTGNWLVLIELALLAGLGTEFVFTEIFAIALP